MGRCNKIYEVKQLPTIPKDEFDIIKELLSHISIPYKNGRSSRHNFTKHRATIFGITRGRFNGIVGLSYYSKKYPKVYEELLRIGRKYCPFEFNSIFINHNVICPKHKDSNNVGESMLLSFGDYTGANIVIDDKVYSADCSPILFDGNNLEHYNTDDLVGNKYSLIFYYSKV